MAIRPKDRIGSFIIRNLLSDGGGMSSVYLAHLADNPKRQAALKISLTSNAAAFSDLLRDETRILSQLRHPGIVHLYSQDVRGKSAYAMKALTHPERPWYYAMEYVSGESLEQMIRKTKSFPLEWKIELFYQVLITINYMHKMGYGHCDLKPANIIFRYTPRADEKPLPVLVDFGSASPVSQIKEKIATIRYASPEIIEAMDSKNAYAHIGIRADKLDVWELGVLLYEIVTGEPLFTGTQKRIKTTILHGGIKRMSSRSGTNPNLDKLLTVMLRKNPDDRPSTDSIIKAIEERISSVRPPRIAMG